MTKKKNKILSKRLLYFCAIFSLISLVIKVSFAQEVVVEEDLEGRKSIRATRFNEDVSIDGILDEAIYESVKPIGDFVQHLPVSGAAASDKTEVWVFYNDQSIYVTAKVYESVPEEDWVANEMRRDVGRLRSNDSFSVMFDTFLDRRNGVAFLVSPIGGFSDFTINNEGMATRPVNFDWNVVWNSRVGRFNGGWTVEMEIPFRSLRYEPRSEQEWGIQFRRVQIRLNEATYITDIPISAANIGPPMVAGMWRISEAATLTDLEVPPRNFNLEIKPYGLGTVTTNRVAIPPINGEFANEAGVDVKFGITNNLTADFTYNTDFAQVEVDERQVNLTRFNLFFPEKREFFLEGAANFDFTQPRNLDVPTMFFSRRIGLERGQVVPIEVGGRVTGKVGDFDIGALNIGTDGSGLNNVASTDFSVLRIKRDVLNRSRIGMIYTDRSESLLGEGANTLYGVDGTFNFFDDIQISTFAAKSKSPGLTNDDESYMANFNYNGDRYGIRSGYLVVEDNFNPEVGFKRRNNFKQYEGNVRFSPRPASIESVRQFSFEAQTRSYWSATSGELETRRHEFIFNTQFESGDQFRFTNRDEFEMLTRAFRIAPKVSLQPGTYDFRSSEISYSLGPQRNISGRLSYRFGDFWSGTNSAIGISGGSIELSPQLSVEPSYSFNEIKLPEGNFRTELGRFRVTYTISPRMYFSGLVQYNSTQHSLSSNLRFRWEWSPGSELFIVYSDDRDTNPFDRPDSFELRNQGWAIKFNRLFQI